MSGRRTGHRLRKLEGTREQSTLSNHKCASLQVPVLEIDPSAQKVNIVGIERQNRGVVAPHPPRSNPYPNSTPVLKTRDVRSTDDAPLNVHDVLALQYAKQGFIVSILDALL